MAGMTYPYEVIRVPGTEALQTLAELRRKGNGVPVILGSQETFERVVGSMESNEATPEELIEEARKIDVAAWLAERLAEDADAYDIDPADWPEGEESPPPNVTITAHCDVLTQEPHAEVFITVLPAAEPWMAPCLLKIGGWNAVPEAQQHAALFKYWAEKHGATVACIADDVIELTVERPAATREEALALAKEQYIYCPDIVDQGVESIEMLAAVLLGATVWYFWWD
jgi:hypothetical protein